MLQVIKDVSYFGAQWTPVSSSQLACLAMLLGYYGMNGNKAAVWYLNLLARAQDLRIDISEPDAIDLLCQSYDLPIKRVTNGSFASIQASIDMDEPIILHQCKGPSILVFGYNDTDLICHDPVGRLTKDGFEFNSEIEPTLGRQVYYSMIETIVSLYTDGPNSLKYHRSAYD